jgi:2OG-Fe(II) oxygenase superfamily
MWYRTGDQATAGRTPRRTADRCGHTTGQARLSGEPRWQARQFRSTDMPAPRRAGPPENTRPPRPRPFGPQTEQNSLLLTDQERFFYLTGHGVPDALAARVLAEARRLFALPQADKDAIAMVRSPLLGEPGRPGLQVRHGRDGGWIDVPAVDGAFVVNIGELLEVATGGYLRATEHRVSLQSEVDRISVPFFLSAAGRADPGPVAAGGIGDAGKHAHRPLGPDLLDLRP